MTTLLFVRRSTLPVRAIPVPEGHPAPWTDRAQRAGFGPHPAPHPGHVAEILTKTRRNLLIRCTHDLEAAGALAVARLSNVPAIAIDARNLSPIDAAHLAAGATLRAWRFHRFLTHPDPERPILDTIEIVTRHPKAARAEWATLAPGVDGALFARNLVIEPGNTLTPQALALRLRDLEADGIDVQIIEGDDLIPLGGLTAVGRASINPPCLAVLRWPGNGNADPVLFVGKGITFDTGGVCIKPAQGLWDMCTDMAGAAACAGALRALARRNSPAAAIAVLPLAENAIGANSYRPGDVLRLVDGTSVEIVDTDAEGRLILADALAWAIRRYRPQAVLDLATLTGSIITALGHHMAGMFATDDVLAAHVAAAGAAVDELAWRMPLDEGYGEALESDIADIRQCSEGPRQPDACHAAHFLQRFTGETPWVHLDIAGVENHETNTDRHPAGPSGWGARLLDRLIRDRFENPHRT